MVTDRLKRHIRAAMKTLLVLLDGFLGCNSDIKRIKDIEEHLTPIFLTSIISKLNFGVSQNAGSAVVKGG